ncbi:MAG: hypothetical protein HKO65_06555 [Gemmatimonadetes bacterium]|nr:hypothetical protein [Gemmatimonadota bacterium]NNM04749.1 hypothetical protein [Gemmatimonadota bacterium]
MFPVLVVVLIGAGYVAMKTGYLNPMQIARWFEPTPGEVSLVNLTDGDMTVRLVRLDTESGLEEGEGIVRVESMSIDGLGGLVPGGRFRLEIQGPARASGQCVLQIERGETYRAVAVPEGIALTRQGWEARSAAALRMETSPLCSG